MTEKILVTYASKYGSTREVAAAVAAAVAEALTGTLNGTGLSVDCLPAREVRDLEGYRAVVLGAPLYMFHWHKDALQFLSRCRRALEALPVAVFALGPFNDKEDEWQEVRGELDKELAKFPWLTPAAVTVFGGKFDPNALTFPWNLVPALKNMPPSDIRDWDKIRAWAESLFPVLTGEMVKVA